MQFTIQQSTLLKSLKICAPALSDNKILPINEMFLFSIKGSELDVCACDMKIIIGTTAEIQSMIADFKICIPGRKLLDYISNSANEPLTFIIDRHITPEKREMVIHPTTGNEREVVTPEEVTYSVTIKTKSGKYTLPCEPGDEFPTIANVDPHAFKLPAEDFLEMLYKTMFAISDDQLRPSATGLNIDMQPGKVMATALDFNMVSTRTFESDLDFEANFIIPKKSLQQIQSLSPAGEINLSISKSAIDINWANIRTTSILIDASFPDYKAVTPVDNDIDFLTSKAALVSSLKRVIKAADIGRLVKLNISENSLLLIAENIDYSEDASETIDGILSGSPITIGVNGEFLLSILNSFVDDKIWFSFSTPRRAMIITEGEKHVNPSRENLVLLMPLFTS